MSRPFFFRKLFFKLLSSYLAIIVLALAVLGVLFVYMMQKYFFNVQGWELSSRADKIISLMEQPLADGENDEIRRLAGTMGYTYDISIRVIDAEGQTVANSDTGPDIERLQLEEHELAGALAGNIITRQVTGPDSNSLYYVKPIIKGKNGEIINQMPVGEGERNEDWRVLGVLAVGAPLGATSSTITNVARLGVYAAIPAIMLAIGAGFSLSRRISRPIEEMNRVAAEIADGNLEKRVFYRSGDETEQLANSFNRAVEEILSTLEQQKKLERLRKELLSNISHEFKAPLTSIRGFLELMTDGKLNNGEQKKYTEIMLRDAIHLNRLVQDLLDLSSLESGEIRMRMAAHNVSQMINWVFKNTRPGAESKGLLLVMDIEPQLPDVFCDRDRIHQVLFNLVGNAVRHTKRGGVITIIGRRSDTDDRAVCIAVHDTGEGISENELENIWERFYKVDRARTRTEPGTGLGLAIVKEIVEQHGGSVYVKSSPGAGSEFGFLLPVAS